MSKPVVLKVKLALLNFRPLVFAEQPMTLLRPAEESLCRLGNRLSFMRFH